MLLYELLTGTTPFDGETLRKAAFDEMRRIIREEEPPRPSTRLSTLGATLSTVSANRGSDPRRLDRSVRGELDWIVMKALEKDRRRRYETANDFAADVMRYLTDQPVEACPPSAWYRLREVRPPQPGGPDDGRPGRRWPWSRARPSSTWQAVRADGASGGRPSALATARAQRPAGPPGRGRDVHPGRREVARQAGGLTPLQREFLEKALAFYEEFAAERADDPEVRREAARAPVRVGEIRSKLGLHKEAEAAIGRAIGRFEGLTHDFPASPAYRGDLGWGLKVLGTEQYHLGRRREAEESARRAVAILEPLLAAVPEGVAARRDLGLGVDPARQPDRRDGPPRGGGAGVPQGAGNLEGPSWPRPRPMP